VQLLSEPTADRWPEDQTVKKLEIGKETTFWSKSAPMIGMVGFSTTNHIDSSSLMGDPPRSRGTRQAG